MFGCDHDEVRAKLGICEEWLQPLAPYCPPNMLSIDRDEWKAAIRLLEAAKTFTSPPNTDSGADYFSALKQAAADFDSFHMPF